MYKTDIHIHTAESSICSRVRARKMVKLYDNAGYATIVITDHLSAENLRKYRRKKWNKQIDYLCLGYEMAVDYAKKDELEINILFAVEITLSETNSDYLIYGITKEFLNEHAKLYELSLKELHELCKNNGFLLIQAHPFRDGIKRADFEDVDGFEGYNGCHDVNSRNVKAMNYGINSGKFITSGSDFHHKKDLARGGFKSENEIKTMEELIDTLRYKNIVLIKSDDE